MAVRGRSCCKVLDVQRLLDSGRLGAAKMGVLQVFRILGIEELSRWEQRAIGFGASSVGLGLRAPGTDMAARFEVARDHLR